MKSRRIVSRSPSPGPRASRGAALKGNSDPSMITSSSSSATTTSTPSSFVSSRYDGETQAVLSAATQAVSSYTSSATSSNEPRLHHYSTRSVNHEQDLKEANALSLRVTERIGSAGAHHCITRHYARHHHQQSAAATGDLLDEAYMYRAATSLTSENIAAAENLDVLEAEEREAAVLQQQHRPQHQAKGCLSRCVRKLAPSSDWIHPAARAYRSVQAVFLPEGYPDSVTPDYLPFQCWDTLQAVCSYLRGILCVQALLAGVGVGNADATATAAAITWVMRDGVGMFGGLLFAWWKSSAFQAHVKFWRLYADAINDVGLTLELVSPMFPDHFLLIASVGSICRAMCGIAAGATRAALTHHFARRRNFADISVKEGSQETAVTLIGMLIGFQVAKWLDKSTQGTWAVFGVLTLIHVVANYCAVKSLVLTSLNRERLEILIEDFLLQARSDDGRVINTNVLTPSQVCARESLLRPFLPATSAALSASSDSLPSEPAPHKKRKVYGYKVIRFAMAALGVLWTMVKWTVRAVLYAAAMPWRILMWSLGSFAQRYLLPEYSLLRRFAIRLGVPFYVVAPTPRFFLRLRAALLPGTRYLIGETALIREHLDAEPTDASAASSQHATSAAHSTAATLAISYADEAHRRAMQIKVNGCRLVNVVLHPEASDRDQCQALFHAFVLACMADQSSSSSSSSSSKFPRFATLSDVDRFVDLFFDIFWSAMSRAGWDLNHVELGTLPWRCEWHISSDASSSSSSSSSDLDSDSFSSTSSTLPTYEPYYLSTPSASSSSSSKFSFSSSSSSSSFSVAESLHLKNVVHQSAQKNKQI